jgi:hypothetical protein
MAQCHRLTLCQPTEGAGYDQIFAVMKANFSAFGMLYVHCQMHKASGEQ